MLYTGNGGTQSITGTGFQPDLVWTKGRSNANANYLFDIIRGTTYAVNSDSTAAEQSASGVTSFDSDGFTLGTQTAINGNTKTYVAWNWKAGGTAVSNTSGSITSQVSANTAAGFSIVSYTANGSSTDTIGHGLSKQLEMVLVKRRTSARNWHIGHKDLPFSSASDSHHGYMAFTTGANNTVNGGRANIPNATTFQGQDSNGETMIAYCFHSVDGFSKIGSYTGNGNADGPFIYTGFQPKYVMVKATNNPSGSQAHDWIIRDDGRSPNNQVHDYLWANSSAEEDDPTKFQGYFDMLSNGFKLRYNRVGENGSGGNYIYMAFAEFPFKFATAR